MFKLLILLATIVITPTIYTFQVPAADGTAIDFNQFQHKKILIVNTASGSRYASQFASLEQLYERYKDSLVIVAVPSNSFSHESMSNSEIRQLITSRYNAHYLIAEKSDVSEAGGMPLYQWLTKVGTNGVMQSEIGDDFQKYLVNSDGTLKGYFISAVDPMDSMIQNAIR